jgi:hypothetical protein
MLVAAPGCLQTEEQVPAAPPVRDIGSSQQEIGAQIGSQLGNQLGSQLGVQLGSQLGVQLGSQLGTQLGTQFGTQLGLQLGTQFGTQAGRQFGTQFGTQFGSQLGIQFGSQSGVGADFIHSIVPLQIWDDCGAGLGKCPGMVIPPNAFTTAARKGLFKAAGSTLAVDTINAGTVTTTTGTTLAKIAGGASLFGDTRSGSWHRWDLGPSFGDPAVYTDDMLSSAIFVSGACTFKNLDYTQAQNGTLASRTANQSYNIAPRSRRLAELLQMTCGSSTALPVSMRNQTFWMATASPEMLNLINNNYASCILRDFNSQLGVYQWRLAADSDPADIARCNGSGPDVAWPRAGIANFVLKAMVFGLDMPIVVPWLHIDGTTKAYWYGGDENDSRMNGAAAFSRLDVLPKSAATTATQQSLIYAWNMVYLTLHQIVNTTAWQISPRVLDRPGSTVGLSTHSDAYDNSNTLAIANKLSRYVQFQGGTVTFRGRQYDGVVWAVQIVNSGGRARDYLSAIGAWPITKGPAADTLSGLICTWDLHPLDCPLAITDGVNNGVYFDPLLLVGSLSAGPRLDASGNVIGQRETLVLAVVTWVDGIGFGPGQVTFNYGDTFRDSGTDGVFGNADDIGIYVGVGLHNLKNATNHYLGIDAGGVDIAGFSASLSIYPTGALVNHDRAMMSYTTGTGAVGEDNLFGGASYAN